MVNELAKDGPYFISVLDILQHMASIALEKATGIQSVKWQTILEKSYEAKQALIINSNLKLTITNFMLSI